jgi:hypothetical protein
MADTDEALTLQRAGGATWAAAAWATDGTATRPNATVPLNRTARHPNKRCAERWDRVEDLLSVIGLLVGWSVPP